MMKLLPILMLLLPSVALGQGEPALNALVGRAARLEAHRGRLEQLLAAQVRRISRLKSQPPGVRRDYQLKGALRENQELATKLTGLQEEIRELNTRLVAAYDGAIASTADPAERARLKQRRDKLARSARQGPRIVTRESANPLDSAEDLEEKADLLKDSEEKVRRQLRQIQQQIQRLKHRARLKRHSRAVDDSPFVEDSPRRLARAKTGSGKSAGATAMDGDAYETAPQDPAVPAPPSAGLDSNTKMNDGAAAGGGSWTGSPGRSEAGGTDLSLTIRGVMDPGTLRELQQAARSGNVQDRIAALEKARKRLEQVARGLSTQASKLRKQAKAVK